MKRALVLNDEPTLHLALGLLLEGTGAEVVHLARQSELQAALAPEVCAVLVDAGSPGLELGPLLRALEQRAPSAGLVLLGAWPLGQVRPARRLLVVERPYAEREAVAAFVRACATGEGR